MDRTAFSGVVFLPRMRLMFQLLRSALRRSRFTPRFYRRVAETQRKNPPFPVCAVFVLICVIRVKPPLLKTKNYQTNPFWIFHSAHQHRQFVTRCTEPQKKRTHFSAFDRHKSPIFWQDTKAGGAVLADGGRSQGDIQIRLSRCLLGKG